MSTPETPVLCPLIETCNVPIHKRQFDEYCGDRWIYCYYAKGKIEEYKATPSEWAKTFWYDKP